jgi:arabinose-5-phosphate isomerase
VDTIEEARRVLKIEAQALLELSERLDASFQQALQLIHRCLGRVIVTGMGKSGLVGKKIAATFSSIGVPSYFLHPAEAGHGDLGLLTREDVLLAISNSGETQEVLQLLPHLKRFGVPLVALTGNASSTLARAADVHIDIRVSQEACPLGVVPTASSTAALAMGDALAVALIKLRGLSPQDFATFHPGGSLGRKLLIKVGDLMHTGQGLPRVWTHTPMSEAVVEISSKRLGITTVLDAEEKVVGVITDGDLRRGIQRWGREFFDLKAGDVMTPKPKCIGPEELAARALAVMQTHSITALVVPDSQGRALGVLHIHDILKQGIA